MLLQNGTWWARRSRRLLSPRLSLPAVLTVQSASATLWRSRVAKRGTTFGRPETMRFLKATAHALPFVRRTVIFVLLLTLLVTIRLLKNANTYGLSESRRTSQEFVRTLNDSRRNETSASSVVSIPESLNSSSVSVRAIEHSISSDLVFDAIPSTASNTSRDRQLSSGVNHVSSQVDHGRTALLRFPGHTWPSPNFPKLNLENAEISRAHK